MSILKELLALREAETPSNGPVEIKDAVKFFPSTAQKMIKMLADKGRLTFGGQVLYTANGEDGPAMDDAIAAATQFIEDRKVEIEVRIEEPGHGDGKGRLHDLIDDDDEDDDEEMRGLRDKLKRRAGPAPLELEGNDRYEFEASISSSTVTWVGYQTKSNQILIGFDAWIEEDEFNDEWDDRFEDAFGVSFDDDNPQHYDVFQKAWKNFKDHNSFYGALVAVDEHGDVEEYTSMDEGGFHRGIMKRMDKRNVLEF